MVYDSRTEASFAEKLENNNHIKLYVKLPDWFKIPTTIGTYNRDWAIVIEKDGSYKVCFVDESKGDVSVSALRPTEATKIKCGHALFKALGENVGFEKVDNFDGFIVWV